MHLQLLTCSNANALAVRFDKPDMPFLGSLMRTLVVLLFSTTLAIAQEGIPANVGNGSLPPGLEGETDLNAIQQRRIEALQLAFDALQNRFAEGSIGSSMLIAAQIELTIAKLEATTAKKERLDQMETALVKALLLWQRAEVMQKLGAGRASDEIEARAAVFHFRAMWLAEKAEGLQRSLNAQEGIPANVGNGTLPPGLEGETDLIAIKQKRIEALQLALEDQQNRYAQGLTKLSVLLATQHELTIANLECTPVKKERLAHIEATLMKSLLTWQSAEVRKNHGSGSAADEVEARAAVFRFRAMWLAEKAEGAQQSINAQEGIPANVGDGSLPPGLQGETDLIAVKQRRLEALQHYALVQHSQYGRGLHNISHSLASKIELAIANLDLATLKNERLAHIETALTNALLTWQFFDVRQKLGVDDDKIDEAKARAAVFKLRAMWLAEKAGD